MYGDFPVLSMKWYIYKTSQRQGDMNIAWSSLYNLNKLTKNQLSMKEKLIKTIIDK